MDNNDLQELVKVFKSAPGNISLAEIIIKELKKNGSQTALIEFLAVSDLLVLAEQSISIAREIGVFYFEQKQFVKAVTCFKAALASPDLPKDEKLIVLRQLMQCLVVTNQDEELRKYFQQLQVEYPETDHSEFEASLSKIDNKHVDDLQFLESQSTELAELTVFEAIPKENLGITFDDVGGLEDLKNSARMKIIKPFQHPELFKKYGKKAGGGILLYGPPGCGKTFFARAIAGECEATFFNVGIHEILNMWMGNSERNIHNLFETVRKNAPAILFVDELDALGRKRELTRHSAITGSINAFLTEMDGLHGSNDNILVIGATNVPWDVDTAFKRPGRFDTLFLVQPPDLFGREEILKKQMQGRPAENIDYSYLAQHTEHFSGADLAGLVEKATENVLDDILKTDREREIQMDDFLWALSHSKETISEWLSMADNYVEYANQDGQYDELKILVQSNEKGKQKKFGFF